MDNQRPTTSYVLPYEESEGKKAVELYNKSDRKAIKWQEYLVEDILSKNSEGLWVHSKFGFSVPRRNGKSEILSMIMLYGLSEGLKISYTAHRTTTSNTIWTRMNEILESLGFEEKRDFKTNKAYGLEDIRMGKAKINFRTRSTKGGLGEGYDILIIDEAQEYTNDQETALKYVVSDSKNPLTVMCGTPPTPLSSGTVFTKYRDATLKGERENSGWAEWSVEERSDIRDKSLWEMCNPSYGIIISERAIQDEVGTDEIDFNIQRLGLWLKYNLQSAISEREWLELAVDVLPAFHGKIYAGIKYGRDGNNVALSIALKIKDSEDIFVESIDCRSIKEGSDWIIAFLKGINLGGVVVDGASGQKLLEEDMKDSGLMKPKLPSVKEIILANSTFERRLYSKGLRHKAQKSLVASVTNCEKRAIGSNGGFGFRSINENIDIALMDSMILAQWICSEAKEDYVQQISY